MNEKVIGFSRLWLIVGAVLFVWGVGRTVSAVLYQSVNAVDNTSGEKLTGLIEQHNDTTVGVLDDIVATKSDIQSAIRRTAELEQRIERAYEYAQFTDGELADLRGAMGTMGNSLSDIIRFQQGIIDFVGRIERNNQAIKNELRGGNGEGN